MPLGLTHADGSPYQSLSTHAGNPLLISLDWLVDRGWLEQDIWEKAEDNSQWRFETLARGCMNALEVIDDHTRADFQRFVRGRTTGLMIMQSLSCLKSLSMEQAG